MSHLARAKQFITQYLAEAGEDSLTCLINTAVSHRAMVADDAVPTMLSAVSELVDESRVSLGEMRYDTHGRERMKILTGASRETILEWSRHITWSADKRLWIWDKATGFMAYVILGTTSRWRAAKPEDPEPV